MSHDPDDESSAQARAWQAHNLSQLLYFRSLSLRAKLEAVEGMADVVRLLEQMRARQRPADPRVTEQVESGREFMKNYGDTFKGLAK